MNVNKASEAELREYLASISPARLARLKWPTVFWRGRGRCFGYFNGGLRPAGISPSMAHGVSRHTLYLYFNEWQILMAKRRLASIASSRKGLEGKGGG